MGTYNIKCAVMSLWVCDSEQYHSYACIWKDKLLETWWSPETEDSKTWENRPVVLETKDYDASSAERKSSHENCRSYCLHQCQCP